MPVYSFFKCQNISLSNYHQDLAVITFLNTFLIENVSKNQMCEKNLILSSNELYDFKNAVIENPNWQKFTIDIMQVLSACFLKNCIIENV